MTTNRALEWVGEAAERYSNLRWYQKLDLRLLRFTGRQYVRDEVLVEGGRPTPLYLFWCNQRHATEDKMHGPVMDYPHTEERLDCPLCKEQRPHYQAPDLTNVVPLSPT